MPLIWDRPHSWSRIRYLTTSCRPLSLFWSCFLWDLNFPQFPFLSDSPFSWLIKVLISLFRFFLLRRTPSYTPSLYRLECFHPICFPLNLTSPWTAPSIFLYIFTLGLLHIWCESTLDRATFPLYLIYFAPPFYSLTQYSQLIIYSPILDYISVHVCLSACREHTVTHRCHDWLSRYHLFYFYFLQFSVLGK